MTTNVTPFSGTFYREGKIFLNPETQVSLLITERQAVKPNKPPLFLLQILSTGQRLYVSSLYPLNGGNEYYFDYQGMKYKLKFDYDKLEVSEYLKKESS